MSMNLADLLTVLIVLFPAPKDLPEERGFTAQTSAEFQKTWDELYTKGWRLKRIKGYEQNGDSRFDSAWHRPINPPRNWATHNIDRDLYNAKTAQFKKDGYAEKLTSTWTVNGKVRFWTVWELK
jgi:hypothetical protein